MYKTVQSSRLYEQIVQQIEDSILKGTLKTGDQLPAERELAQQFGVSRTAVREAVKALSEKELVEAYSGRGTFVTNGTSQAIRHSLDLMMRINQQDGLAHLVEVRELLEREIAAMAAMRLDGQHLANMRQAVSVMDSALKDPDAYIEADLDFHLSRRGRPEPHHFVSYRFDCGPAARAAGANLLRGRRSGARTVSPQAHPPGCRAAGSGKVA